MPARLLDPAGYPSAIQLCQWSTAHNVILLANLVHLPTDRGLVDFWGHFSPRGDLVGVLLRCHTLVLSLRSPRAAPDGWRLLSVRLDTVRWF
ncbi:MAG: hypothetical protein AB1445_12685 [Bacillota bacterium]